MMSGTHSPSGDRAAHRSVVVGLGATGLSCVRHLVAAGETVAVTDSRERPPCLDTLLAELPDVRLALGGLDTGLLAKADRVIVSPGVADDVPFLDEARERGVEVMGDIELFARQAPAPVVAITGSNGKSTVTTMVAAMARRAGVDVRAGGNLGPPALDLLRGPAAGLYVLELSSFQLERTWSLRPAVAVVLNLSADHMDRHKGLDAYAAAKGRVYRHCEIAVINRDDAAAAALAGGAPETISFGLDEPAAEQYGLRSDDGRTVLVRGDRVLMDAADLKVRGRHNLANALAAMAVSEAAGFGLKAMIEALRAYEGLPHRTQLVAQAGGYDWIDDSKATNVGATIAAVSGFDGPLVLIAGGDAKGADLAPLASALRGKLRGAVLIGRDAPKLEAVLDDLCLTRRADDMDEAVALAARLAEAGDTVLLSPACASLDMYTDYVARGKAFAAAVERWA